MLKESNPSLSLLKAFTWPKLSCATCCTAWGSNIAATTVSPRLAREMHGKSSLSLSLGFRKTKAVMRCILQRMTYSYCSDHGFTEAGKREMHIYVFADISICVCAYLRHSRWSWWGKYLMKLDFCKCAPRTNRIEQTILQTDEENTFDCSSRSYFGQMQ